MPEEDHVSSPLQLFRTGVVIYVGSLPNPASRLRRCGETHGAIVHAKLISPMRCCFRTSHTFQVPYDGTGERRSLRPPAPTAFDSYYYQATSVAPQRTCSQPPMCCTVPGNSVQWQTRLTKHVTDREMSEACPSHEKACLYDVNVV